uniref:Uncharacterized protein n=1 Tax=Romanomermis culicivorax TaxID=13658 RepID=A0A915IN78_ROMCU
MQSISFLKKFMSNAVVEARVSLLRVVTATTSTMNCCKKSAFPVTRLAQLVRAGERPRIATAIADKNRCVIQIAVLTHAFHSGAFNFDQFSAVDVRRPSIEIFPFVISIQKILNLILQHFRRINTRIGPCKGHFFSILMKISHLNPTQLSDVYFPGTRKQNSPKLI